MEDSSTNTANNVARAIAAALDWTSSPDARKAAVSFLESVPSLSLSLSLSLCVLYVYQFYLPMRVILCYIQLSICS
jgi:exportin-5